MSASPRILNAALQAYIATFPRQDRLAAHLENAGLEAEAAAIQGDLDALVKFASAHLYHLPEGAAWDDPDFVACYFSHLKKHYPWLDEASLVTIRSYSMWYCWHEGLNRPTKLDLHLSVG